MPVPDNPIYALALLPTAKTFCIQPVAPNVDFEPVSLSSASSEAHKYFIADGARRSSNSVFKELRDTCLRVLPGAIVLDDVEITHVQAWIRDFQTLKLGENIHLTFCEARDALFYGFFERSPMYKKVNVGAKSMELQRVIAILSVFRDFSIGIRSTRTHKQFEFSQEQHAVTGFDFENDRTIVKRANETMLKSLNYEHGAYSLKRVKLSRGLLVDEDCYFSGIPDYFVDLISTFVDSLSAITATPSATQTSGSYSYVRSLYYENKDKCDVLEQYFRKYLSDKSCPSQDKDSMKKMQTSVRTTWVKFEEAVKNIGFELEDNATEHTNKTFNLTTLTSMKWSLDEQTETRARWLAFVNRLVRVLGVVSTDVTDACKSLTDYTIIIELASTDDVPIKHTSRKLLKKYMLHYISLIRAKVEHRILRYNQEPRQEKYWDMTDDVTNHFTQESPDLHEFVTCFDKIERWLGESVQIMTQQRYSSGYTWQVLFAPTYGLYVREKMKRFVGTNAKEVKAIEDRTQDMEKEISRHLQTLLPTPFYTVDSDFSNDVQCTPRGILRAIHSLTGADIEKMEVLIEDDVDMDSSFQPSLYCLCKAVCQIAHVYAPHKNIYLAFKYDNEDRNWVTPQDVQGKDVLEISVTGALPPGRCRIHRICKSVQQPSNESREPSIEQGDRPSIGSHKPTAKQGGRSSVESSEPSTEQGGQPSTESSKPSTEQGGEPLPNPSEHADINTRSQATSSDVASSQLDTQSNAARWVCGKTLLGCACDRAPYLISLFIFVVTIFIFVALGMAWYTDSMVFQTELRRFADNRTVDAIERSNPFQLRMLEAICAQNLLTMLEGYWDSSVSYEFSEASKLYVASIEYATDAMKDGPDSGMFDVFSKHIGLVVGAVATSVITAAFGAHKSDEYLLTSALIAAFHSSDMTLNQGAFVAGISAVSVKAGQTVVEVWSKKKSKKNRHACLKAWGVVCVENVTEKVSNIKDIRFGCNFNPTALL